MGFGHLNNLRKRIIRKEDGQLKILLANFEGTTQQKDIERKTHLIEDFYRIKEDVPAFGDSNFDWRNKDAIKKAMAIDRFDMPSWAQYKIDGKIELSKGLKKWYKVFIYQLKACNLHCNYCYVDDVNKNGKQDNNARFFSIPEIVDAFERQQKRDDILWRLRASGGEPTLAIEQIPALEDVLEERDLIKKVHLQMDTNLTTGSFIEYLENSGDVPKGILNDIAGYKNFSVLASFKGTDSESFAKNTRAEPKLFEEQFYSFGRLVDAGIDVYPFVYAPNPLTLPNFAHRFKDEFGQNALKKLWAFRLNAEYDVPKARLGEERAKEYHNELQMNFEKSEDVLRKICEKEGFSYKQELRTGIPYN